MSMSEEVDSFDQCFQLVPTNVGDSVAIHMVLYIVSTRLPCVHHNKLWNEDID